MWSQIKIQCRFDPSGSSSSMRVANNALSNHGLAQWWGVGSVFVKVTSSNLAAGRPFIRNECFSSKMQMLWRYLQIWHLNYNINFLAILVPEIEISSKKMKFLAIVTSQPLGIKSKCKVHWTRQIFPVKHRSTFEPFLAEIEICNNEKFYPFSR
jgi:hypothetical protein